MNLDPNNNRNKALEAMLREAVDDEPKSHCAENGTMCPFCFEQYKNEWPTKGFHVKHHEGCWITRAKKLLNME